MSSSRIHSIQPSQSLHDAYNSYTSKASRIPSLRLIFQRSPQRRKHNNSTSQRGSPTERSTSTASPRDAAVGGAEEADTDKEMEAELGLPGVHAPFPGLREACEACGALSVSRFGAGTRRCDSCSRIGGDGDGGGKAKRGNRDSQKEEVAVTSVREIALGGYYIRALLWTGGVMVGAATLLLTLLLAAWQGFNTTLVSTLSPWLAIYIPIPLGLLNGLWSVHCAKAGHIRRQRTGSCITRGGLCGTAWGCSGPSCALNVGLDLGLLITALLASMPAAAAPRGCGYECYVLLCFPCAPVGGVGMATFMVLSALALAGGAVAKMWIMSKAFATRRGGIGGDGFLPW